MSNTPDETSSQLFDENMWLQGALITAVGYGCVLTLFVLAFHLLWTRMNKWNRRSHIAFLVYISVQFILATLFQASSARFTQLAFINDRNFPGGPGAFELAFFYLPIDMLGNVSYVLTNWLADGLLLWRCAIIYGNCRLPMWMVIGFPMLIMLGSLGTGIMYLLQVSTSSPFLPSSANFTIIYSSISLALNLLLTIMIIGRLLVYRYRINKYLSERSSEKEYTSVIAMLVESAGLYAAFSLFFIIPFGLGSSVENIAFQALSQVQIISPFLIIVRVSQGKAWSSATAKVIESATDGMREPNDTVTEIQFASGEEEISMVNASTLNASTSNLKNSINGDSKTTTQTV